MLNEKNSVQTIFRAIPRTVDGIVLIGSSIISLVMLCLNAIWPDVLPAGIALENGKWISVWLLYPLLALLLYLRARQLLEGESTAVNLVRSLFLITPTLLLLFLNIH
jgi:hypothetical protein